MKPMIYISGPFSADTNAGIEQNIYVASLVALECWKRGWAVLCPHKNTSDFQHANLPYNMWIDGDLEFIKRMRPETDALLMLHEWESSRGAKMEYELAKQMGLKIFFCKDGIPRGE